MKISGTVSELWSGRETLTGGRPDGGHDIIRPVFNGRSMKKSRYVVKIRRSAAQSVGHLTRKSGVLGSIPGLATYFRFSFRFFKKGSCQLLAKVCARSTG